MLFYTCTDIAEKTDLFSFFLSQCLQKAVEFGTIFFFFIFNFQYRMTLLVTLPLSFVRFLNPKISHSRPESVHQARGVLSSSDFASLLY